MTRNTTIINISAEPEFAKLLETQAKKEKKTKSELMRRAFESYVWTSRMREIQKVGAKIARDLGLESLDDIEKYAG